MWIYEKRLQFPVNIKETNAKLAQNIISQYGGANGRICILCSPIFSKQLKTIPSYAILIVFIE